MMPIIENMITLNNKQIITTLVHASTEQLRFVCFFACVVPILSLFLSLPPLSQLDLKAFAT